MNLICSQTPLPCNLLRTDRRRALVAFEPVKSDASNKVVGVSFQLAIATVSCAKTASWKLTPLSNVTLVGQVQSAHRPFACGFAVTPGGAGAFVAIPDALRLTFQLYKSGT